MPFPDRVNASLQRVSGLRLTRETPEERREVIDKAAAAAARRARKRTAAEHRQLAAERKLQQEREREERFTRGDDLPRHYDDETRSIIARVRRRTMTGHVEIVALIEAVRYIVKRAIPGEIVECGVWRGGSIQAAALSLLDAGATERELHLFDTFEGMTPPTDLDYRMTDGQSAESIMATSESDARIFAYASLDDVREAMAEVEYPSEKIFYHKGRVEDTVPDEAPGEIALLRLDTDWYDSTRHTLEHLYDRLSPGGILIIDDYSWWAGSHRGTEEWLERTGEPLFLSPIGPARMAVKPLGR